MNPSMNPLLIFSKMLFGLATNLCPVLPYMLQTEPYYSVRSGTFLLLQIVRHSFDLLLKKTSTLFYNKKIRTHNVEVDNYLTLGSDNETIYDFKNPPFRLCLPPNFINLL